MGKRSRYNAHVLPPTAGSLRASAPVQKIVESQTTIDHLLETGEIHPPQLVKLDVQGMN